MINKNDLDKMEEILYRYFKRKRFRKYSDRIARRLSKEITHIFYQQVRKKGLFKYEDD